MYTWIDSCIESLKEFYESNHLYELISFLGIRLIYLDSTNPLLRNTEGMYNRFFNDEEMIFLRNDLNPEFEKFVIAHELGHALLHTELTTAAFSNKHMNSGKVEKQANYFAKKLLNLDVSGELFNDLSCEHFIALLRSHYKNY